MTDIRLENVCTRVLNNINLSVAKGELFVLLGPSGAGKSTLLQTIAGLLPYQGSIFFNGNCIDRRVPHQRRVGYLFQDLLLFPHLTIKRNLLLAMVHLKTRRRIGEQKACDLLSQFRIEHIADRLPGQVSGGEKQRAALARAIATEPRILLLDEPFSSLDEHNAKHLRNELKKHQCYFGITTLFVTHNHSEARELADRVGVIRDGRVMKERAYIKSLEFAQK
jgi:ABC-type sulfate/molybdate transport systems ATPase subunit